MLSACIKCSTNRHSLTYLMNKCRLAFLCHYDHYTCTMYIHSLHLFFDSQTLDNTGPYKTDKKTDEQKTDRLNTIQHEITRT